MQQEIYLQNVVKSSQNNWKKFISLTETKAYIQLIICHNSNKKII